MPRPPANNIYTAFINHELCTLTEEHRQELHEQRGFNDEIINNAKFRSGQPGNAEIINALQGQFSREQLIDAGLLSVSAGNVHHNSMLLEPRVLIPYLTENGQGVYHLRPHRMGLKGAGISYYCAGQQSEHRVLTESEFKAVASYAYGYAAIGLPGVGSFARQHFNELMNHIIGESVNHITVIYDTEVKDDPALPGYKPNPDNRWDTQYFACLMALRIGENAGIQTRIGILPPEWMINGKIDIDGALAAGHTAEEFAAVVHSALRWRDYLEGLPTEGQRLVRRKLKAFELSLKIRRTSRYEVLRRGAGDEEHWTPISNFVMNIVGRVETPTGLLRDVRFKLDNGSETGIFRIDCRSIVKPKDFQQALYGFGKGEQQFWGADTDLMAVMELEHTRAKDAIIVEPDHVGKIIGKDLWLFENGALSNGEFVPAGENRTCWNGEHGYRATSYVGDGSVELSKWQQRIPRPDFNHLDSVDLKEIARRLYRNFGSEQGGHHALLAFAWGLSCPYSHEFYDHFGSFPLLYLIGPPESGKSTMAKWVCRLSGITVPGYNVDEATVVGIGRLVAYYSSLPAFFDECRERVLSRGGKETLFRSIYDRQPAVKGTRDASNQMRITVVRAPVVISGEQVPTDPALNTRCLFPEFSTKRKNYGCEYTWLEQHSRTVFPRVLPWILMRGAGAENVISSAEGYYNSFRQVYNARIALNHAVVMAVYNALVDPADEFGFLNWMVGACNRVKDDQQDESDLMIFFEDLVHLKHDGEIKEGIDYEIKGAELHMALRHCWEQWEKRQRMLPNREPMRANTAVKLLKQTDYVLAYNKTERIGGKPMKVIVFDLNPEKGCPASLLSFAGALGHTSEPAVPAEQTLF